MQKRTWEFDNVGIISRAAVAGPFEGQGKLGAEFDRIYKDLYMGQATWEKAERYMMEDAISITLAKAGVTADKIDVLLAGDLLNQNITSSFSALKLGIPFIGLYGACSTAVLTMIMASALVSSKMASLAVAGASSHNCATEKQFRYPTEYGGQKPDIAQWTVTGAGACLIGREVAGPQLTMATIGKVVDLGISDPLDMGSAMAPAAVDVISNHFLESGRTPDYYDLIITGDLGKIGHKIAGDMLKDNGYKLKDKFADCGMMIYKPEQETFAGGSGCASSAVVAYSYLLNQLEQGALNKILLVGTGALLSPISYQQGESIPVIAHAIAIESGRV